ncbi:uncharacterized protein LMH87_007595 [Akanthomyces muscarius]|uniref:Uncharacterized protein n=1 Tax=Akanthomyces muscarius TaxID=2231603 RepID=A0A9W8QMG7_AKAMU|nr:uncharacterized protein LMH87_007595 [Akanthomyces muscarius]KAJ4161563.1 hypothetical protein LMH87_007595 [Akanthomyces muscarius]
MARRLQTVNYFKYLPIVLLAPVVHISLKSMMPALENRATPTLADNTKSFNILLAKDNTMNQKLAVKILEKYYRVMT